MDSEYSGNVIVLANWKAYFSPERALSWCDQFIASYRPVAGVDAVVAVPFFYLREVAGKLSSLSGVSVAAQSVSSYPQGSYTGSTPAAWLRGAAGYTLLGHRERRQYFHETAQDVAKQVYESLAEELQPIICVDRDNLMAQTAIFDMEEMEQLIWAYTPKDAEQLERSHGDRAIAEAVKSLSRKVGGRPVLYGGGVNLDNGRRLLEIEGVSGILVGRACLNAGEFVRLIDSLEQ